MRTLSIFSNISSVIFVGSGKNFSKSRSFPAIMTSGSKIIFCFDTFVSSLNRFCMSCSRKISQIDCYRPDMGRLHLKNLYSRDDDMNISVQKKNEYVLIAKGFFLVNSISQKLGGGSSFFLEININFINFYIYLHLVWISRKTTYIN